MNIKYSIFTINYGIILTRDGDHLSEDIFFVIGENIIRENSRWRDCIALRHKGKQ